MKYAMTGRLLVISGLLSMAGCVVEPVPGPPPAPAPVVYAPGPDYYYGAPYYPAPPIALSFGFGGRGYYGGRRRW